MTDTFVCEVVAPTGAAPRDLNHIVCCDATLALCGTSIPADEPWVDMSEVDCAVCLDLKLVPCPLCWEET